MALTKIQAAGLTADLIDETKLADNSIDSEHYNDGSIDNVHLADDAVGVDELSATGTASSSTFLRGDNSWATPTDTNTVYTHPNHSGEVTSTADGAQVIADDVVDEANLKVSNAPTNGYFLSAQSGNTGGLTWAEAGGGKLLQRKYVSAGSQQTLSTTSWTDVTGITYDFTPVSSSSKIMIYGCLNAYVSGTTSYHGLMAYKLQKDGSSINSHAEWKIGSGYGSNTGAASQGQFYYSYVEDSGGTSERTYKMIAQNQETTNGAAIINVYGGGTWMFIDEYST